MTKRGVAMFLSGSMAFLAACGPATMGRRFDSTQVAQIRKGQTTRQEVVRMLGEPASKDTTNKNERWSYSYTESKSGMNPLLFVPVVNLFVLLFGKSKATSKMHSLSLAFSKGVVSECVYSSSTADMSFRLVGTSGISDQASRSECGEDASQE
jgi:outer membrane protein assembly factor BamE (lipoprotein component of BamABCDE complex)